MPFRREPWFRRSLVWWLAVLAVVVQLKYHYSVDTAADLEWMFRPLSLLLEWFSGYEFHRDSNYEWFSQAADVRLVKSCAGINFMLMSFMAYAWLIRPDYHLHAGPLSRISGHLLLLCAAIIASWATCLLANSLRIIVAMTVKNLAWETDAIGIDAEELHRLIGMMTYVPILSLQMMLGNRATTRDALAAPALLYLLLLVVVPLITGNALQHPALFMKHLIHVSVLITVMGSIYFLYSYRLASKGHQSGIDSAEIPRRPKPKAPPGSCNSRGNRVYPN